MCWRFTCVSVCTNPRVPERDRSCTSRFFVYLSSCLFLSRPLLFPPTGMYLEDLGATVSLVEGAQQWLGGSCPFLRPHPCSLLLDSHASTRVVAPPHPGTHLGLILVLSSTHEISTFTFSCIYIYLNFPMPIFDSPFLHQQGDSFV